MNASIFFGIGGGGVLLGEPGLSLTLVSYSVLGIMYYFRRFLIGQAGAERHPNHCSGKE